MIDKLLKIVRGDGVDLNNARLVYNSLIEKMDEAAEELNKVSQTFKYGGAVTKEDLLQIPFVDTAQGEKGTLIGHKSIAYRLRPPAGLNCLLFITDVLPGGLLEFHHHPSLIETTWVISGESIFNDAPATLWSRHQYKPGEQHQIKNETDQVSRYLVIFQDV